MTIYPAAMSIPAMIKRLRSLPAPPTIERRDDEELPELPTRPPNRASLPLTSKGE